MRRAARTRFLSSFEIHGIACPALPACWVPNPTPDVSLHERTGAKGQPFLSGASLPADRIRLTSSAPHPMAPVHIRARAPVVHASSRELFLDLPTRHDIHGCRKRVATSKARGPTVGSRPPPRGSTLYARLRCQTRNRASASFRFSPKRPLL